jgi:tRNA(His) 5'-end guanylyltransferase
MVDDLGNRMKGYYESRAVNSLLRRTPVIVRVDGKAFHTFCKRFEKPYDVDFHQTMNRVMVSLCEKVQGVKFAERHSDEISLVLTDYDKLTSDAFFDYNVQKLCSITAGFATASLIQNLMYLKDTMESGEDILGSEYLKYQEDWPIFDSRCFNIPEREVANYFHWRLLDAKRNSVSMQAQSKFSHKKLQGKNSNEMQEMLFQEHGINCGQLPQEVKTGFVCSKRSVDKEVTKGPNKGQTYSRSTWVVEPAPRGLDELREVVTDAITPKTS